MKRWWQLLVIFWLGISLSLGLSQNLKAQIAPSQLVQQAQVSYQRGEFQRAIQLLEQANRIYQSQARYLQQVQVLSLTSLAQQQLGEWQLASQNLVNGSQIVNSLADSDRKIQVLAQIWNTKGQLQFLRGNSTQALEDWQTAEALYRQTEDRLGIVGSLLNQAQALEKMGFYRRACDTVLEAFERPDYSCEQLTTSQLETLIEQAKTETELWQIEGLNSISNSLLLMGNLSQAIALAQTSRMINSTLSNPFPLTKAKILLSLGNINKAIAFKEREIGNFQSFSYHYAEAVKYYQKLSNYQPYPELARKYQIPAQLNLLSLSIVAEKWSEAQRLAGNISLHPDNLLNQPNLYAPVKLARDLERLKQNKIDVQYSWQDLAEIYLNVAKQAEKIGDRRVQSYALGYLGILKSKQQNLKLDETPQQLIEKALSLAQQIQAREISFRWQWKLGQIYRQQGRRQTAIASYQASLASLANLRSDVATLTQEIQFNFQEQIEPIYREFADLLLAKHPRDRELVMTRDLIEALHIAELDNYFQDACLIFEPKRIDQVDRNAAVIHTIVLPDRLEVIMAMSSLDSNSPGQVFRHHTQLISQTELEQTISQLRLYITEPDRTREVQQLSAQIYDWLIRPFTNSLEIYKPNTLVFVLDSILQSIPMSVLYDGQQYLLEKYAISLTPGLQLLNPQVPAEKSAFLAGGITQPLQVANQKFSPLDNVKTELAVLPETNSEILLNQEFTPSNLLAQINTTSASHIHIATHGQFSSDPNRTFLLMWQKLLTIKEFSLILLKRKKIVTVPIELLVLSACDTASGDRRAALGLAGVAVRSGALSTMATLWQVNDESTAILMKNFYQNLKKGLDKAESLRQAQLQLWEIPNKDWRVPAFWSAYIMIGNWQ